MRKKTVLIHSNFCKAFTGFGKNKKNLLKYLYKTGKYRVVEAANGKIVGEPSTDLLPWECYGCIPQNYDQLPESQKKIAGYGGLEIERIVNEVKPDLYIGIEDIWAFESMPQQSWWNKVNKMIWTTLDSLPILQQAIDFAPKVDQYYVWASFAEREMKKLGYDHVKTLRGSLDTDQYFRLDNEKRDNLRKFHNISKDDFIVGFVFRNQLRKSVPNLLDGFKIFKEKVSNAKLLLHTHWSEGWDIPRLIEEKGIDARDILTTYFCSRCESYKVHPFIGQGKKCPSCGSEKTYNTTNIAHGVSEDQLREVYNLMDVYCHPFTSGGQEIPVQEAKLTELITLVTNYSCGEDSCSEESGGIPLNWHEYREPGTQFIKASTDADHIAEMLQKVYEMNPEERLTTGKKARKWVIDNFSIEAVGKQLEKIIDETPFVDHSLCGPTIFNENYTPPPNLPLQDLIIDLYKNILKDKVDKNSTGLKHWVGKISSGEMTAQQVFEHFIKIAKEQNSKSSKKVDFKSIFTDEDKGKRIAVMIPESETDVLFVNSLLKNLQRKHKNHNIYIFTKPQNFEYIEDNPNVYKCLPYSAEVDNAMLLEGGGDHEGYFEYAYFPTVTTQKFPCYIHNGK
jgi:glycosyltransferase involved in cell wall biosynthesis